MKNCKYCNKEFKLEHHLQRYCKECQKIPRETRRYRKVELDKICEYCNKSYKTTRSFQKYCKNCQEKAYHEYDVKHLKENRREINLKNLERNREWLKIPGNREKKNKYYREWRAKHRPQIREQGLIYYYKNQEKHSMYNSKRHHKYKHIILNHYGGKCVWCGQTHPIVLSLDHINDDGGKHRKKVFNMNKWIIDNNFPKTFQILCRSCNWAKNQNHIYDKETKTYILKKQQMAKLIFNLLWQKNK